MRHVPTGFEESIHAHIENAPVVTTLPQVGEWPQESLLCLDDIQQLPAFYSAVNTVLKERRSTIRLSEETAEHELQHMEAFEAIGSSSGKPYIVEAGICVVRHPLQTRLHLGRLSLVPVTYTSPRLEPLKKAAVLGHPEKLSKRDAEHIQALGYQSVSALSNTIASYNHSHPNSPLPLPLSVS